MRHISEEEWQLGFGSWLRTGRLPEVSRIQTAELKFNPWHDPANGRFTYANSGTSYAGGGGSFGGAGATADLPPAPSATRSSRRTNSSALPSFPRKLQHPIMPGAAAPEKLHRVVKNGYSFDIDEHGRTRGVSGDITIANRPVRSRTAQGRAGGLERRASDDGGHYIGARFNGPTDAFNHFAQDASFNRGAYRALEDKWAKARREGRKVTVTILPRYAGGSVRPSSVEVRFVIDGVARGTTFSNEKGGR